MAGIYPKAKVPMPKDEGVHFPGTPMMPAGGARQKTKLGQGKGAPAKKKPPIKPAVRDRYA